ncbi:MAG: hypothetical protein ACRDFS_06295 [Chloroflexota bacterium]
MRHQQMEVSERHLHLPVRFEYLLLAAVMAFFALTYVKNMSQIRLLNGQQAALQQQNRGIQRHNVRMQKALHYYRTIGYARTAARTMGFTMAGDVPVISRPTYRLAAAPPKPAPPPPSTASPWVQWWDSFSGQPPPSPNSRHRSS